MLCDTMHMKASDIIKVLEAAGWTAERQSGSHRQFKHPTNPSVVTVPVHGAKDATWAPGSAVGQPRRGA